MANITNQDLASRLDLIQQSVWNTEEYAIKNLGKTEQNHSQINELKFCLEVLNEKLNKIEIEIRGLRNNETDESPYD